MKERDGVRFAGQAIINGTHVHDVNGSLNDQHIHYRETHAKGQGFEMDGTLDGSDINLTVGGKGPLGGQRSGSGKLTLR